MVSRLGKGLVIGLVLSAVASAAVGSVNDSVSGSDVQQAAPVAHGTELQQLEQGLPAKYKELAYLHRKWVIAKGRVPTAAELKKFQEKQAKGVATPADNPYVNRSALSSPGRHRAAYYKKLAEIKADEARIAQLREATPQ
jgi:hypothetical protein